MSGRPRPARRRRADLSQHFLREARAARLIRSTSITLADFVLEIGPGRGVLTKPLLKRAGRLQAVELDPHLARKLERALGDRAEIVAGDFLATPLPDGPYKVIGNVPFAITTAIVRRLVDAPNPPEDAWLVVQRELAHRLCGRPYTNESLWSLELKPQWHVEIVDRLSRTDFDPPPSVDAAFLWLCRRGRPLLGNREMALYRALTRDAFLNGATLGQALRLRLSKLEVRRLALDLRFDVSASPSTLVFEQWLGILRFLAG